MKHPTFKTVVKAMAYAHERNFKSVIDPAVPRVGEPYLESPGEWTVADRITTTQAYEQQADVVQHVVLTGLRDDLETYVFPEYRYAWGHYYPLRASSALIAEGAAGKSMLMLAQMIHAAAGKPYCGLDTMEGIYVYMSFEDDKEVIERRAQRIMKTFTVEERAKVKANFKIIEGVGKGWRFVFSKDGMTAVSPTVDRIILAIKKFAAERPVIHCCVDTVSRVLGAAENETEVMSAVEQAVSRFAQELDCAATAIHHVSKAVAREGIADAHAGRGAASFGDNMRSVVRLMPLTWSMVNQAKLDGLERSDVDRGDILKLVHAKLNQDRKSDPIYLKRNVNGLLDKIEVTIRSEAQDADTELQSLCAWYARTDKPFTVTTAARTERLQWTKMAKAAATTFVENLVSDGKLIQDGATKGHALYVPAPGVLIPKIDPFET